MKKITFFTGAGMSKESGIETFRGSNGMWGDYNIDEVATVEAWHNNPQLVLDFYNDRRVVCNEAQPNAGHLDIAKFEKENPKFEINIITQNVDDLHERAGSQNVLHLHGKLNEVKTECGAIIIDDWDQDLELDDHIDGSPLRPNVVWFGEDVPNYTIAEEIVNNSDYLIIVGTSLQVYPAASLIDCCVEDCKIYNINPDIDARVWGVEYIQEVTTVGIKQLLGKL